MREFSPAQRKWLTKAQDVGFVGPKSIETVHEHALGFALCIDELLRTGALPSSFRGADLGSGAGVPGLFLAIWFPGASFLLIDSMKKRYRFLESMIDELDLVGRVTVYGGRSETCALSKDFRGSFDLVTARGFATPAATAENGSGLLRKDGVLLVSEPPGSDVSRWPVREVRSLGFSAAVYRKFSYSFCWMVKSAKARGRFPREVGIPEKHPLF